MVRAGMEGHSWRWACALRGRLDTVPAPKSCPDEPVTAPANTIVGTIIGRIAGIGRVVGP